MHVVSAHVEEMKVLAGSVRVHALAGELLQVGKLEVLQVLGSSLVGVHQAGFLHSVRHGCVLSCVADLSVAMGDISFYPQMRMAKS